VAPVIIAVLDWRFVVMLIPLRLIGS
jgi:hypothetical protein